MKLQEIYELVVQRGIDVDPRGRETVEKELEKARQKYEELKADEREEFDTDKLSNPYSDTRILYGDPGHEVASVLVGVDMEVGEVVLADRLSEKGQKIDLIISHHPEGKALAALHDVMHLQEDVLANYGVPINVAQGIMSSRISEVRRGLMPLNHNRAVDAARVLDIPMMCVHTPADNQVVSFLQKIIDERQPETLKDIVKILKEQPEYAQAVRLNAGPFIVIGSPERKAGKVWVDMTGGTGGSEDAYSKLATAGVGTIVVMHIGEKHRKEAEKNHINVIIAGHIASDSLGMNLLLDRLAERGVESVPCAGLLRVDRRS
ncbi:MAG: NGG1p interacting factor NIF3 [Eubacteriales bacterium]|jgi:putative NIF3 family GTP cyclohydrolase 1 type 2|nr:Nif3-like dinuclear metal center hexameric protein [Bacillota bacterium]MBV1726508.1 Nif3-like dinuclear metal center hexameric protein [Desulforudis sp.]MDQ7789008.1 NGG1p interacting factor NIF3 [Clostridia bacterium]MDZ4044108.1 NGG1p interacting factor NIF3 [Eubacteriales bacterium]MBU4532035.1 Nif3-like dinuclear metal center hexameric protein [Bacillota bacterium]